jgi:NADH-quinone oxidoreductase subunit M
MGLPMLNGFVGEYLVLLGTYQSHWAWASWAALGVILSACYLLWSYQRVFFGEVTREKNKTLADASAREKFILVTMSIVMLWMGIGSTYFTRRTAAASQAVIDQVEPQRPYEARVPAGAGSRVQAVVGSTNNLRDAKEIPAAEGANR